GVDQAVDIAVDNDGFAYITGQTDSADFPGPNPIQSAKGAQTDVFVLKLNQAGDAVIYGAWLGGRSTEGGAEIAVDATGAVVITGFTNSDDFPTKNALQPTRKGATDAFVAKLNSAGNDLIYSTYLGGSLSDSANALTVDASGSAYVTGITDSLDFPVKGAFQNDKQGSAFYASGNSGGDWKASGPGLSGSQVYDIAIDSGNPTTIYAGTDRGVFKSVNGGGSWSQAGAPFSLPVFQLVVDPTAPANVYALTQTFIYKSVDGGATWSPIQILQGVQTIAISPSAPAATIYAATSTTFLKSVDGGMNWTPISLPSIGGVTPRVFTIVADPTTPTIVYAGAINGVYRSADGGTIWAPLSSGFPQNRAFSVSRLAISKSNPATLLAEVFNVGAYKTTNGGADWTAVGLPAPPAARLTFAIDPGDPSRIYAGALGYGIYKSVDGGGTWSSANNGLGNYNVRALAVAPNSSSTVYTGTGAGPDAFVAKINPAGSELVFSSYLGGGGGDTGVGIALDAANNVYVTGTTESTNFPAIGAYQPTIKGALDAFVTKINPSGSAILWSTYLGGAGPENGADIAVFSPDQVIVTGSTGSTDFPTVKAIQSTNRSVSPATADAFVSRFSADGARLEFSTYLGGGGSDFAFAIAVDGAANVYLTGSTSSNDFPVINAVQTTRGGDPQFPFTDAFVTKLDTNGSGLIYSTYLGGSGSDQGAGVATDGMNNAYVTGLASSSDFPTTLNPLRAAGFSDSFVTKLAIRADLAIAISDLPDPVMVNNNLTYTLIVTNSGPDAAQGVSVTDTLPTGVEFVSTNASQGSCGASNPITCAIGSIAPNARATITIVVKPTATGMITNRATARSDTSDANEGDNTATQETRVSTIPSIFGRVTTGAGAGLGEVAVALTGAQRPAATTASDGGYQFPELPPGANYMVTPSRPGYVFNPATRPINDLQTDQRADFQAVSCAFSIAPRNQSFAATGGSGGVTITSPDPRCPWTARSDAPWIKITSASTGNGNGIVTFSVEPTVGSRIGAITVAGATFTVSQEFNACNAVTFKTPRILTVSGPRGTLPGLTAKDFNNDGVSDLIYYVSQPEVGVAI
ncbi:MAG TPA: SBBP repeat-containing protein, partial [Blastocatellia bacterium]|nr:SBBP repeat-containing protein [Blastocatellia bacterium]